MLSNIRRIFGSRSKALEAVYVLECTKKVIRHCFSEYELKNVKEFCSRSKLFVEVSPNKVTFKDKSAFSNEGQITNAGNGLFLAYISKEQVSALKTCLYETRQDHFNTGLMLGYPSCCCNFFVKEFSKENLNPVHKPTNPWTNITLREQDIVLISHFPCSSECKASIEIAKRNLEIIKKQDAKLAEYYLQKLNA